MKIYCEICEGTGYDCLDAHNTCSIRCQCPNCQGKGYIERELKAEDLSVEEQWRIVTDYLNTAFGKEIAWQGLKK